MPNPRGRGRSGGGDCACQQGRERESVLQSPLELTAVFLVEDRQGGPRGRQQPPASSVAVGDLPGLAMPRCPRLSNGNANTHLTGLLTCQTSPRACTVFLKKHFVNVRCAVKMSTILVPIRNQKELGEIVYYQASPYFLNNIPPTKEIRLSFNFGLLCYENK